MMSFAVPPPAPRGRTMLKVTGILLIVFCGLAIIPQLLNMLTLPFVISEGDFQNPTIVVMVVIVALFYLTVDLGLAAGILGLVAAAKPQKGKACFRFGIVLMVLPFLPLIVSLYIWKSSESLMLILLSAPVLILGLLYTIGAYQYQKHYQEFLRSQQKEME